LLHLQDIGKVACGVVGRPAHRPPSTHGSVPIDAAGCGHPALRNHKGCGVRVDTPRVLAPLRFAGVWASTPTRSQGGVSAPVLSGIQNVITDGNPAKWVEGVSKKGRGTGGFVKITRGKSDGLIRF